MWCMFHVFMLPRIVCKLRHRQEIAPIVLASNDKLTEINLYPLVHSFGLFIGTRVEAVLMFCCMPVALQTALAKWLVNRGSRSEMMRFGIPNQGKRCWKWSCATP